MAQRHARSVACARPRAAPRHAAPRPHQLRARDVDDDALGYDAGAGLEEGCVGVLDGRDRRGRAGPGVDHQRALGGNQVAAPGARRVGRQRPGACRALGGAGLVGVGPEVGGGAAEAPGAQPEAKAVRASRRRGAAPLGGVVGLQRAAVAGRAHCGGRAGRGAGGDGAGGGAAVSLQTATARRPAPGACPASCCAAAGPRAPAAPGAARMGGIGVAHAPIATLPSVM
jgi:hypothetical protein